MMPPGVDPKWEMNSDLVVSYLLMYDQIRRMEDLELMAAMVPRI